MAEVAEIWTAPNSSASMESHTAVSLVAGLGIEGDRYAEQAGTYTIFKEPGRQLTLISRESAVAAMAAAGCTPVPVGALRRNVVVAGLTSEALLAARGHQIALGAHCRIFVHRDCKPCAYNQAKNGEGLMDALWEAAGVSCEVLVGGSLDVGDSVRVVPESHEPERVDTGGKGEVFFLRPKLRSAEQVRASRKGMAELYARVSVSDPEGAGRATAAYASVGLSFWPRPDAFKGRGQGELKAAEGVAELRTCMSAALFVLPILAAWAAAVYVVGVWR